MASIASDEFINTILAKKQKTFIFNHQNRMFGVFLAKTAFINSSEAMEADGMAGRSERDVNVSGGGGGGALWN
jgi:hypothetical protein